MHVSLKVVFGVVLLVLAAALSVSVFVLLTEASKEAIDEAVEMVVVRTHDRMRAGLQDYFRAGYPTADTLALMFEKDALQVDSTNTTMNGYLRAMMWEMILQNPSLLYLLAIEYPSGELVGFTQILVYDEPYYDFFQSKEGTEWMSAFYINHTTGVIDFSNDNGGEYNASVEIIADPKRNPDSPRVRSWTAAYLYWDGQVEEMAFLSSFQSYFYNETTGAMRGTVQLDLSLRFFSDFLSKMTYTESEEYFLLEGTVSEFSYVVRLDDLHVLGVSDRVKYPLLVGEGEGQTTRTFKNLSVAVESAVPRMVQAEVERRWGTWRKAKEWLEGAVGNTTEPLESVTVMTRGEADGEGYYVAWSLFRELNLRFVLCSTVKESEYMGKLEDGMELATVISVVLAVVVLVVCEVVVWLLFRPLGKLVAGMAAASAMRFDTLPDMQPNSILYEVHVLQKSFVSLAGMMIEYKSFLPSSMFEHVWLPDDVSESSATTQLHDTTDSMSPAFLKVALSARKVAVMAVSAPHFASANCDLAAGVAVESYTSFVGVVEDCIQPLGVLDRLDGDRVLCTWGASKSCSRPSAGAVQAALALTGSTSLPSAFNDVGVGVACGKCYAGNMGTAKHRSYLVIGRAVGSGHMLSRLAAAVGKCVFAATAVQREVETEFESVPVACVEGSVTYHVLRAREEVNEEWMYVLDNINNTEGTKHEEVLAKWLSCAAKAGGEYEEIAVSCEHPLVGYVRNKYNPKISRILLRALTTNTPWLVCENPGNFGDALNGHLLEAQEV